MVVYLSAGQYINPQVWFIPTLDSWVSSSGRRPLQTEALSMAHMGRVDRKRKSAPPAAVSGSTSSKDVSTERQFFTHRTSALLAKKYSIPSGPVASATIGGYQIQHLLVTEPLVLSPHNILRWPEPPPTMVT